MKQNDSLSSKENVQILAIPGDGIGKEVVPIAVDVLRLAVPFVEVRTEDAGYERWLECGESISMRTLKMAWAADGVLFGCTGTPSPPPAGYRSPILTLRKHLKLNINHRYCRSINGHPLNVVMIRDCSEGLYVQREHAIPGGMVAEHQVTRTATSRVAEVAAAFARRRLGRVTIVHKANVLKQTDGLFRQVAIETLEAEGIEWDEALSDAAGYHLVMDPKRYDIMLMTSHVGDLLSDLGAAVAGGLGLVPSLSLGEGPPLAEPIHGSAPDLVGRGMADPVATILSAGLLLEELGFRKEGHQLRSVVESHLAARTPSQLLKTKEIAEDIIQRLRNEKVI